MVRSKAIRFARKMDAKLQTKVSKHQSNDYFWEFVTNLGVPELDFPPKGERMSIDWLIPSFSVGSGGHMTIFRMIRYLERKGHRQRIFIVGPTAFSSGAEAFRSINRDFLELGVPVFIDSHAAGHVDVAVATSWLTCYYVAPLRGVGRKWYFVQDYEPLFYPMGAEYYFARDTYEMGFHGITAGPWLSQLIEQAHSMPCKSFQLAVESKYQLTNLGDRAKRIVFYSRYATSRRCVEMGILALRKICGEFPEWEVSLFGSDAFDVPFHCSFEGVLDSDKLVALYNKSSIGLVLSGTNYSLIPNEMMACGLSVVDLNTECNRMIYEDEENVLLAEPNVESIYQSVRRLILDADLRIRIGKSGRELASRWTWSDAGARVESAFLGE